MYSKWTNTYIDQRRNGMNIVGVTQNGWSKRSNAQSNGPGRVSLQLDHFISTVHNLCVQFIPLFCVLVSANMWIQFTQTHASNINTRPNGNCNNKKTWSFHHQFEINELKNANYWIDYLPDESPCSPMIQPWHEVGAILRRWLMRKRNRDESKFVPEPMTRFLGKPLNFHAT